VAPPGDLEPGLPTLVLVRHGQSTWNRDHLVQGQNDESVLTEDGRAQVRAAAASLRGSGLDLIIASDLTRTVESARIVAEVLGLEVELDPALRERDYGVLEGGPVGHATPEQTGVLDGRVVDVHAAPAGGESLADVYARAGAFVERLVTARAGRRPVLVTHGGMIRALRPYCAGRSMTDEVWDHVGNASVWRVEVLARRGAP
jgi:broad specificity phosphatase PhoE